MDKKVLEKKYIKETKQSFENFEENNLSQNSSHSSFFTNIWKPILKLLLAFVFVCLLIYTLNLKMKDNKNEFFDKIEGTWIDENNNNYEIYDNKIEINQGIKNKPFYIAEITNILETDTGYKIVTKGTSIEYKNTENLEEEKIEKSLNLSIEITDYTEELQKPMNIILGKNKLGILKVKNKEE